MRMTNRLMHNSVRKVVPECVFKPLLRSGARIVLFCRLNAARKTVQSLSEKFAVGVEAYFAGASPCLVRQVDLFRWHKVAHKLPFDAVYT